MNNIISTQSIIKNAKYFSDVSDFFGAFEDLWAKVRGQILKLETRQTYSEPGNESYESDRKTMNYIVYLLKKRSTL